MSEIQFESSKVKVGKVLCVGRNYAEHIKELNNAMPEQMVVFNKPASSVSPTLHAFHHEPLHYEAEICFLVEQGQYVGVGLGLDLTKRALQSRLKEKGLPWERAKAFDGSAVFSRFKSLPGIDIHELNLELFINCVRVQKGHVKQMLYPPLEILAELKTYTSVEDGDIVMTGTPQGVGEVHRGDVFLGRLKCGDVTLLEIEWVAS
ncbi:fumarylacetoacetate hydrolase family protein [Vibrio sp. CAU 1672]|uniref:fumarylacetoacetate hydrolase family protein n=1 Tax=Vibrio sp. CAU 1672 TaxID=3032594 RepID=UPI0023D9895D|nr:fumarylacetoacetate hydrolase family protein [Vibrio sp. CAU 1672]MDF2152717.1 fumarylacetoacetate hydrolase family protein [Vibrio sp. CAU 1672]